MNRSEILDARALLAGANTVGRLADGRHVLAVPVPAGSAVQAWRGLRELHSETGLWPFLTDPAREGGRADVRAWFGADGTAAAEAPETGEAARLFERWHAEFFGTDEDDPFYDEHEIARIETAHRCGPLDLPAEPRERECWAAETTEIMLCPAAAGGAEIPRLIAWGGAAGCAISGAQHELVLAHWNGRFGAELLTLGLDVIELCVANPPTDPAEVARTAEEQTDYCSDIVDRGIGSTTALAEQQVYSHTWFFWWD